MDDCHYQGQSVAFNEQVMTVTRQVVLGLIYHLPDDCRDKETVYQSAVAIEKIKVELAKTIQEKEKLTKKMGMLETDLAMIKDELNTLKEMGKYEILRSSLKCDFQDRVAYNKALAEAASRVPDQMSHLETLSRKVDELLKEEREILETDVRKQMLEWVTVEKQVFK